MPNSQAFCPSVAFIEKKPITDPPPEFNLFKKWAGEQVIERKRVESAYDTLNECWHHYHPDSSSEASSEPEE